MSNGQPVVQSGSVTPGHLATWTTDGVVQDSGPATSGGVTEVGITNNGNISLGINSGPTTGAFVQLGFSVSDTGTITISASGKNGAPAAALDFDINGTIITIGGQAPIGAHLLLGNPGTTSAPPSGIAVGANLTLSATGTLSATAISGTTTTVVAVAPLTGGTITTSGTIGFETIAASSLFGNAGTAAGALSAVAIGPGLSLAAAGTLSVGGTAAPTLPGLTLATTPLAVASGGLGAGTLLANGVLLASGSGTSVTSLQPGSPGSLMISSGGVWTAGAPPLSVADGGTGATSLTANGALVSNGSGNAAATVAPGTSGNVLTSNGTSWGSAAPSGSQWTAGSVSGLAGGLTISGTTLTAPSSIFAIGTYLYAQYHVSATPTAGTTYAGSTLYNAASGTSFSASGTWRCMGAHNSFSCCAFSIALFLRVA